MMGGEFGMGFGGGFMWLFWILVVVVIVWAIRVIIGSGSNPSAKQNSILNILKERYARGEIDREEFEQKRKDLGV